MKKKGFTLSEMVVAVALVGVVAAVSVPLINSIVPDRKKVVVLKVHKQLTAINQELLSNPSLYVESNGCTGLECTDAPLGWTPSNPEIIEMENSINLARGNSKYITLLADHLNATNINIGQGSFDTLDGINWNFNGFDITIDIDSQNNSGCSYDVTTCQNPDQFEFRVSSTTGRVEGVDALATAYLANPHKLSDKKNDYKKAVELNKKFAIQ